MKDQATSVLSKLRNISKQSGIPLQMHLQLFCQEEFLRKLSLSKYTNNFVLKGGLFIYTLTNFQSRATIDVDFLVRQLPATVIEMEQIINEILSVDTGNNFVTFEAGSFEEISPQRKYQGISCKIVGHIKNTKTPFSIDIGIGDIIIPNAQRRKIPVQLQGFTTPEIYTYSLESSIAEKFETILQRLELTSRMKDFYDIYYLSQMYNFDGEILQRALTKTLQNRKTKYHKDSLQNIASFKNNDDMIHRWERGLKGVKPAELGFGEVITGIVKFLEPVWNSIIIDKEYSGTWDCKRNAWTKK